MSRASFVVALLACASFAREARADDVLVGYDPEIGTYIGTKDKAWLFNPYAMVQLTHVTTWSRGDVQTSGFNLHAAKAIAHGHIYAPELTYHLQVNFGEGKTAAEDLYLRWDPDARFGVLVGQNEVPYNRQHITLEAYQELVERSEVDKRFTLQRDIGIAVYGADAAHRLEATAGVFNGSRQDVPNDDRTYMTTLRLAYNPWGPIPFREADLANEPRPKLSIAVAGSENPRRIVPAEAAGASATTLEHVRQGVLETTLRWRGLSMTTEAHARAQRVAHVLRKDAGAFFQTGLFVVPSHVQVAGRIGRATGDLAKGDVAGEQTVGVAWYLHGHRLKLQLDGSRLERRSVAEELRTRLQLELFL